MQYAIDMTNDGRFVRIDYTNYRGERRNRAVQFKEIKFGVTPHHPKPQWLVDAYDINKQAMRTFAMKDIHAIEIMS